MPRAGLDENHVLQAAAELADSLGAEAVTLALLAKQLNVRPPSLYNHIKGLPDLRIKLAVYGLQELYKELKQAKDKAKAKNKTSRDKDLKEPDSKNQEKEAGEKEALYLIMEAYLSFAEEHPGLYELAQRPLEPEVQAAGEPLVQLLLEQMELRGIVGDQAIHAVRGLRSILHGFVSLSQSEAFGLPYAWKESLQYTVAAFLKGLASPNSIA